jgi:chaperone required for assembly of F1-ATPase
MKSAQQGHRAALPKRFYQAVSLSQDADGFGLLLDGKSARTPARHPLKVASRRIAEAMVAEWAAQVGVIDPAKMPVTRLVNVGLDRVSAMRAEVAAETAQYAGSDLLAYRAAEPDRLVERQRAIWDPLLAKAQAAYGVQIALGAGVIFVAQTQATRDTLSAQVIATTDALKLAALSVVTTLTGSLVLALLLRDGHVTANEAWDAAHLDEDFQIEVWGQDDEALARRAARRLDYDAAVLLLQA